MDQSGFNVTSPTILAANVGNNKFIVQICPTSIRLLDVAAVVIQELDMESGFVINSASVSDPYIALMAENGQIVFARFVEGSRLEISMSVPQKVCFRILTIFSEGN